MLKTLMDFLTCSTPHELKSGTSLAVEDKTGLCSYPMEHKQGVCTYSNLNNNDNIKYQCQTSIHDYFTTHHSLDFSKYLDNPNINIILDVCIFTYRVYKDSNPLSIFLGILDFVRKYYKKDISSIIGIIIQDSIQIETQSLSDLRGALDSWSDLAECELLRKLSKVTLGLMACGLLTTMDLPFNYEGFSDLKNRSSPDVSFSSLNNLCFSMCDLALSIVETGYECFVDKSLQPILYKNRVCRIWLKDYQDLIQEIDSIPVNTDYNAAEILSKLDMLLATGLPLIKQNSLVIGPLWKSLQQHRTILLKQYNVATTRRPPFSILIYGPPNIGKSSIALMLMRLYHRVVVKHGVYPDLQFDPKKNIYTINSHDEYMSGFKGATHWCINMDDIASENIQQVKMGKATSVQDVINIINTVGCVTNQADLKDKGTIPMVPKLVIGTTNIKNLNAYSAVAEPAAVLRRFPYVVTPSLKPEYLDSETGGIKADGEMLYDAWDFTLERVQLQTRPNDNNISKVTVVYEKVDNVRSFAQLMAFFTEEILHHERNSAVMESGMNEEFDLCEHGVLSAVKCNRCDFDRRTKISDSVSEPHECQAGFSRIKDFLLPRKKLTLREKIVAKSLYYSHKFLPYEFYAYFTTFALTNAYQNSVVSAVQEDLLKAIPNKVQLMQAFMIPLLTCSAIVYFASYIMDLFRGNITTQGGGEVDIWAKHDKNEFFKVPRTSKPNNLQELKQSVKKSLFRLEIETKKGPMSVSVVPLDNSNYMTVAHIFDDNQTWRCRATYGDRTYLARPEQVFVLERDQVKFLGNDLAVFTSSVLLPRKSLQKFFPRTIDRCGRNGISLNFVQGREDIGEVYTTQMTTPSHNDKFGNPIKGELMSGFRKDRVPREGDCGSVILSNSSKGYFISGIHVAGQVDPDPMMSGGRLLLSQVSQEILPNSQPFLPLSSPGDDSLYKIGSKSSGPLCEPFHKGVHVWTSMRAECLGSYKGRIHPTSSVQSTIIKDDMVAAFNKECNYGQPLMEAIQKKDGSWLNPFTIASKAQGNHVNKFVESDINWCVQHFISDLTKSTNWLKDVKNYDLDVAINGINGTRFIDSLPMSTSGGFYFPGAKRNYFHLNDEEKYEPSKEIVDMVSRIEGNYVLNRRSHIVFNGTLKDEPTKHSKIESGKTRVFTACDVAFSIVVRKQYLGIVKAMMENNFICECAVGMNCYSMQWDALYHFLTSHGSDKIVAGDYANYDKGMMAIWIRAAFHILDTLRNVSQPLGKRDSYISRGIATDVAFPITNMNGELLQFYGGNSSGHPLTVIINSLVNSLYMRFAYMKLGFRLDTFRENVKLMTLGDDNILGSKCDNYNHTTISNLFARYGIRYTMADKEAASVPFINIEKADFLKRSFRIETSRVIAPLSLVSIHKSLCYNVERGNISTEEQIAQTYLSARIEWCLHGEIVFENCVAKMNKIFEKYPSITRFFHKKHFLTFAETREWMVEQPSN